MSPTTFSRHFTKYVPLTCGRTCVVRRGRVMKDKGGRGVMMGYEEKRKGHKYY